VTDIPHKLRYIEAYVHYRKNVHVKIRLPQSDREVHLLNYCFTNAKSYMNSIGKNLHV